MNTFEYVRTSSHRSRERLIRTVGSRPELFRWGKASEPITVGGYFRIPAHKLETALRIKGVTHVKRVPEGLKAYRR